MELAALAALRVGLWPGIAAVVAVSAAGELAERAEARVALLAGSPRVETVRVLAPRDGRHAGRVVVCDTFDSNNNHALDVNADAVGFAILTYAYSTESVNGVPGVRVPGRFQIPEPAGSEGTFQEE